MSTTYPKVYPNKDGWSDWLETSKINQLSCCDCGLVHNYKFRIIKGKVEYKVSRNNKSNRANKKI